MSAFSGLLAAGLALFAVAAVADLAGGARLARVPYLLGAAASACLTAGGAGALAGHQARLWPAGVLGAGTVGLTADRLSGLFLVIAFGAATWVSTGFAGWAGHGGTSRRGLGACYALALAAVAVFLTAGDAFTLLFAWEILTVAFYLLAGFERDKPGRRPARWSRWRSGRSAGRRCWPACCCWPYGPDRSAWPASRSCPRVARAPRPRCCWWPASRSRSGSSRSRSGCRAGTRPHPAPHGR